MAFSENFLVIDAPDGTYVKTFEGASDDRTYEEVLNEVLYDAAKMICFGDCIPDDVREIYVNGAEIKYMGWHPGMLFEFSGANGEIVWSRRFPEWDH